MRHLINPKLRDKNAVICGNCAHWHSDEYEKWGICDCALNSGLFMDHNNHGKWIAHHTNNRYRSNKGCKTRFIRRDSYGTGYVD